MKRIPCILLLTVASLSFFSCSNVAEDETKLPVIAPTVPPPARTTEIVLTPVTRGLGEVQAKNIILTREVETGRQYSELLERQLSEAEAAGEANAGQIAQMRESADGLARALGEAKRELEAQWETLRDTMEQLAVKRSQIAAAEQEKRTLREQVTMLNGRVEAMQGVAQAVGQERDERGRDLAVARAEVENQKAAKRKILAWAIGATALIVGFGVWKGIGLLARIKTGGLRW